MKTSIDICSYEDEANRQCQCQLALLAICARHVVRLIGFQLVGFTGDEHALAIVKGRIKCMLQMFIDNGCVSSIDVEVEHGDGAKVDVNVIWTPVRRAIYDSDMQFPTEPLLVKMLDQCQTYEELCVACDLNGVECIVQPHEFDDVKRLLTTW